MKKIVKSEQSVFLTQKQKLKESGCDDYRKSIKILFANACGISADHIFENHNLKISKECLKLFVILVARRIAGEPLSHIICSRSFWRDNFYIDKKALDPRPDSELIIEKSKNMLFDGMKILDLGCGSGCVGISLYQENPKIKLFLADLSRNALTVSKKNVSKLGVQCKFIESDLFSNIDDKFDLIVANLPYIEKGHFYYLQKEVILYEPHEALYGGVSGLDIINLFLKDVSKYLKKDGSFVIEFGKGQDSFLKRQLITLNFKKFQFYDDMNGISRIVCVKKDT